MEIPAGPPPKPKLDELHTRLHDKISSFIIISQAKPFRKQQKMVDENTPPLIASAIKAIGKEIRFVSLIPGGAKNILNLLSQLLTHTQAIRRALEDAKLSDPPDEVAISYRLALSGVADVDMVQLDQLLRKICDVKEENGEMKDVKKKSMKWWMARKQVDEIEGNLTRREVTMATLVKELRASINPADAPASVWDRVVVNVGAE